MLATNASSSGKLLAFLDSTLPQAKGYPKAATYTLPFFVADLKLGVKKVQINFRTTGGDCRKRVHEEFQRFFQDCGIAQNFRWSPGSWGALHITGRESEQELREKARMIRRSHESGPENTSEQNVPVEASTGGDDVSLSHVETPRDHGTEEQRASEEGVRSRTGTEVLTEGEEPVSASNERYGEHGSIFSTVETEGEEGTMSIAELIHTLDPALKLIAEQAWGEHDEATSEGVLEMLNGFNNSSPLLGEAISEKIWKGRIGLEDVCEGLDQRDVAIAMSIVFHTHRLIEKKGRPKGWSGT